MTRIAVIGAGVIGLTTAVSIQNALGRNCDVTVVADAFYDKTTSHGAAGLVRPSTALMKGVPVHIARNWVRDSWDYFEALAKSEEAEEAGVTYLSGYHIYDHDDPYTLKPNIPAEIMYDFREMTAKELTMFPERQNHGYAMTTFLVECTWFLPYLMKRFHANGGSVLKRTVDSFKELAGDFDVVVNCTGLRSDNLQPDAHMISIRGQMIRIKAPWIKHFYYKNMDTWIIPGKETVTIGGTRQRNSVETAVDKKDTSEVFERACKIMPSLRNGEVQWIWVGHRPHREPIRVEIERLDFGNKQLNVVHNYGHGGNGVSLSWGTAVHAARLVQSLVTKHKL